MPIAPEAFCALLGVGPQFSASKKERWIENLSTLLLGLMCTFVSVVVVAEVKAFQLAHDKLPRIFELLVAFPALRATFEQLASAVPPWTLLRWLPQALAHLPQVPVLFGPLKALARQFPQAVVWPLQLSSSSGDQCFRPLWLELEQTRAPIRLVRAFTQAPVLTKVNDTSRCSLVSVWLSMSGQLARSGVDCCGKSLSPINSQTPSMVGVQTRVMQFPRAARGCSDLSEVERRTSYATHTGTPPLHPRPSSVP